MTDEDKFSCHGVPPYGGKKGAAHTEKYVHSTYTSEVILKMVSKMVSAPENLHF